MDNMFRTELKSIFVLNLQFDLCEFLGDTSVRLEVSYDASLLSEPRLFPDTVFRQWQNFFCQQRVFERVAVDYLNFLTSRT